MRLKFWDRFSADFPTVVSMFVSHVYRPSLACHVRNPQLRSHCFCRTNEINFIGRTQSSTNVLNYFNMYWNVNLIEGLWALQRLSPRFYPKNLRENRCPKYKTVEKIVTVVKKSCRVVCMDDNEVSVVVCEGLWPAICSLVAPCK